MLKYGNTMSLMDATYKTTACLYFLSVYVQTPGTVLLQSL